MAMTTHSAIRRVTILGSTGSIGTQALEVIAANSNQLELVGLSAFSNKELVAAQAKQFGLSEDAIAIGPQAAAQLVTDLDADVVVNGITGSVGLAATLATLKSGKVLALANKESLIVGGPLVKELAKPGQIVPVDSEHSAIAQCLRSGTDVEVAKLILTASGGPFREMPLEQLRDVTPEQACAHPNWSMGRKISVDSASMMNKGLELIEACWLFDARPAQVEVVVHPQSVIHSLVDYVDGSVLAQLGNPDMRTPISHALAWPERIDSGVAPLDLFAVARLDFQAPDEQRFPCLRLARQAAEAGGTAPAMLNAANEVAVAAFLERRIRFPEIASIIEDVLHTEPALAVESLDTVLAADGRARHLAEQWLSRR